MNISYKPFKSNFMTHYTVMSKPKVIPDISQKKDEVSFTGKSDFTFDSIGNKVPKSFENLMHYLLVVQKHKNIYVDNTDEGKVVTLYSSSKNPDIKNKSEYIFTNDGTLKKVIKYIKIQNKYKKEEERVYTDNGETVLYTELLRHKTTSRYYFDYKGELISEEKLT